MRAIGLLLAAASVAAGWPSDPPFWPKYPTRNVQVLDGVWSFGFAENVTLEDVNPNDTSLTPNTTTVPSVFDNAMPGVQGRRGTGFYRTTIQPFTSATSKGSISFAACGFYCKVWLDGVLLGDHTSGGYSQFWFDLPSENSDKPRTLFVASDNRFNQSRTPVYTGGDFWHFAGVTRSVMVHETHKSKSDLYFQRVEFLPVDTEGTVNITVVFRNGTSVKEACLGFSFSNMVGRPVCAPVENLQSKISMYELPCKASKSCSVWSFDEPNLTEVVVTAENSTDAIHTRFGIRTVSSLPGSGTHRIALNGKITKLKGYNRHTMYPDTGLSLTEEEHQADMKLLKELGVNVVRGAHYPQDQRWLDLCDENGIAMWEECLGPGVGPNDVADKWFMQNQLQQADEMVAASINHPSVFFWGFFNEGPSTVQAACDNGYKVMSDRLHSLDASRMVTWADNKLNKSLCLDHADMISFNHYPGWYTNGGPESCGPFWDSMASWVATHKSKPFMISETGAAGIWEWAHNASTVKWGQAYQNEVVKADVIAALNNSQVSSITLWQFMDIKANTDATATCPQCDYLPGVSPPTCGYIDTNCKRPGGENHKGAVDFWRRKKQVFETVSSLYNSNEFGQ